MTAKQMTPIDFAYWLQGYFEISGGDLSLAQIGVIYNKLPNVKGNGSASSADQKAADFVGNLYRVILPPPGGRLDPAVATATLKQQLHNLFVHAIDPSYNGDQSQFNNVHGGQNQDKDDGPRMRC